MLGLDAVATESGGDYYYSYGDTLLFISLNSNNGNIKDNYVF